MAEELTPMLRQYRNAKNELDEQTILFFRMGDFYEMFFEDAKRAAPILGVVVTQRNGVPMCGVPYRAVDSYLSKVLKAGLKAAVCEQVEDPKQAKGIVRREITRIVTPGTIIEDTILDAGVNNFLAAIYAAKQGKGFGLALLELSTGALHVEFCENVDFLTEALQRTHPSETLISEEQENNRELLKVLIPQLTGAITRTDAWRFMSDQAEDVLKRQFHVHSLEGFCGDVFLPWINAAGALIYYVRDVLHTSLEHLRTIDVRHRGQYLILDACSCSHLDLLPEPGKPENETLLGVLDSTQTAMGKRLLRQWLRNPLCKSDEINKRLDSVENLISDRRMLAALRTALADIRDLERLISRLDAGAGNARDLRALGDSLLQLPAVLNSIKNSTAENITTLVTKIDPCENLANELTKGLVDTPPPTVKEGGLIQEGFNSQLDEYRSLATKGREWLAKYQAEQQQQTGIKNLKVLHNNVFGYYIEISKGQLSLVPSSYQRRQTLVNAERFITPELKEYETKIFGAQDKAFALEYEIFQNLRNNAVIATQSIQQTAAAIATLDVLQSFADRALALGYIRPKVDDSDSLIIRDGRHPVVELQPGAERFVPNDTHMDCSTNQFMLITGPNMAGKSTYIRQVAVIAIMAHLGSFVPASEVKIGVMDHVFTRVGAGDELAHGRSTFMVEMQEAAHILNNATPKSLIVLDEIGRGTSTYDGISIAWSVAEYLHNTPERKARTLFATHYHELTALASSLNGVKNYTVQVREQNDTIVFLRRITPGTADKSYGIHVASLAGMPQAIIDRANVILDTLEGQQSPSSPSGKITKENTSLPKPKKVQKTTEDMQCNFFEMLVPYENN